MAHPRYLSRHSSRTTTRQPLLARQARQRRGHAGAAFIIRGAIRLDTTTKRLIAISPVIHYLLFLLWIIDLFQPAPDIGYAFQPPCRTGCPDAHFYGNSASVINHAKASLIGQIVAHKNGNPSAKGASCIKAAIASPLLVPLGLISTTHLPAATPVAASAA